MSKNPSRYRIENETGTSHSSRDCISSFGIAGKGAAFDSTSSSDFNSYSGSTLAGF